MRRQRRKQPLPQFPMMILVPKTAEATTIADTTAPTNTTSTEISTTIAATDDNDVAAATTAPAAATTAANAAAINDLSLQLKELKYEIERNQNRRILATKAARKHGSSPPPMKKTKMTPKRKSARLNKKN